MGIKEELFRDYTDALERGTAALFVGAGLSIPAGYKDWRTLLKNIAEEMSLDAAEEHDLAGLAQYHLNRSGRTRTRLAQLVRDEFGDDHDIPEAHRVLSRLPIAHIWTTNYDRLLERAWAEQNKRLDVKSKDDDISTSDRDAHAPLFKMHGTVEHPTEVVLAKDDYELYLRRRPGFLQMLSSDLRHKTLLFLGLSFTDPNLSHLLAMIRASLGDAPRTHYTIMRRPKESAGGGKGAKEKKARLIYEQKRFELWIDDLQRYGIRALVVDDYGEIPKILSELEAHYARRNVFVSGSYPADGDPEERRFVEAVARGVGQVIAKQKLNLVSGFGLVVGNSVIMGMMEELYQSPFANLSRRVTLRPFPRLVPQGMDEDAFKRRYRQDMISQAGVCIVIAGNKEGKPAPGVRSEVEIARQQRRIVIPVAATGWVAREVWESMRAEKQVPVEVGNKNFVELGARLAERGSDAVKKIVSNVDEIVGGLRGA